MVASRHTGTSNRGGRNSGGSSSSAQKSTTKTKMPTPSALRNLRSEAAGEDIALVIPASGWVRTPTVDKPNISKAASGWGSGNKGLPSSSDWAGSHSTEQFPSLGAGTITTQSAQAVDIPLRPRTTPAPKFNQMPDSSLAPSFLSQQPHHLHPDVSKGAMPQAHFQQQQAFPPQMFFVQQSQNILQNPGFPQQHQISMQQQMNQQPPPMALSPQKVITSGNMQEVVIEPGSWLSKAHQKVDYRAKIAFDGNDDEDDEDEPVTVKQHSSPPQNIVIPKQPAMPLYDEPIGGNIEFENEADNCAQPVYDINDPLNIAAQARFSRFQKLTEAQPEKPPSPHKDSRLSSKGGVSKPMKAKGSEPRPYQRKHHEPNVQSPAKEKRTPDFPEKKPWGSQKSEQSTESLGTIMKQQAEKKELSSVVRQPPKREHQKDYYPQKEYTNRDYYSQQHYSQKDYHAQKDHHTQKDYYSHKEYPQKDYHSPQPHQKPEKPASKQQNIDRKFTKSSNDDKPSTSTSNRRTTEGRAEPKQTKPSRGRNEPAKREQTEEKNEPTKPTPKYPSIVGRTLEKSVRTAQPSAPTTSKARGDEAPVEKQRPNQKRQAAGKQQKSTKDLSEDFISETAETTSNRRTNTSNPKDPHRRAPNKKDDCGGESLETTHKRPVGGPDKKSDVTTSKPRHPMQPKYDAKKFSENRSTTSNDSQKVSGSKSAIKSPSPGFPSSKDDPPTTGPTSSVDLPKKLGSPATSLPIPQFSGLHLDNLHAQNTLVVNETWASSNEPVASARSAIASPRHPPKPPQSPTIPVEPSVVPSTQPIASSMPSSDFAVNFAASHKQPPTTVPAAAALDYRYQNIFIDQSQHHRWSAPIQRYPSPIATVRPQPPRPQHPGDVFGTGAPPSSLIDPATFASYLSSTAGGVPPNSSVSQFFNPVVGSPLPPPPSMSGGQTAGHSITTPNLWNSPFAQAGGMLPPPPVQNPSQQPRQPSQQQLHHQIQQHQQQFFQTQHQQSRIIPAQPPPPHVSGVDSGLLAAAAKLGQAGPSNRHTMSGPPHTTVIPVTSQQQRHHVPTSVSSMPCGDTLQNIGKFEEFMTSSSPMTATSSSFPQQMQHPVQQRHHAMPPQQGTIHHPPQQQQRHHQAGDWNNQRQQGPIPTNQKHDPGASAFGSAPVAAGASMDGSGALRPAPPMPDILKNLSGANRSSQQHSHPPPPFPFSKKQGGPSGNNGGKDPNRQSTASPDVGRPMLRDPPPFPADLRSLAYGPVGWPKDSTGQK